MIVNEKYPIAYTQRFTVIDSKIEALQQEIDNNPVAAKYVDIEENVNTGIIKVSLLNALNQTISSQNIELTGKLVASSTLNMDAKAIVISCLDGSSIQCDISELVNKIIDLENRVEALERAANKSEIEEN